MGDSGFLDLTCRAATATLVSLEKAAEIRRENEDIVKVIVADKISDRGVELLRAQAGWKIVLTTKETLHAEIADADALVVRSATKVTAELLEKAPRLRVVGRAGVGV